VEQEVEGEKIVPRHILEQTRRNGADIATMKVDIGVLESDVATLKADVAILKSDVTAIKSDLRSLSAEVDAHQTNLPRIVADTMREVLHERDR
jgi:outer membrane murein-binding lipoprotein Lpp